MVTNEELLKNLEVENEDRDQAQDVYLNEEVSAIKLYNESWTVVKLKGYYAKSIGDTPQKVGGTDNFPAGQNSTLRLDELDIPDGCWITAYADVRAGKDSRGHVWLKYRKGNNGTAVFTLSGTTISNSVGFNGIRRQ